MPCHHALDTDRLCVYRCPTSLRELANVILGPSGLRTKEKPAMIPCVVCEEKPATALDADGDRVCGECKEIAVDLLKHYPELNEPVECLTCGKLPCEDVLCRMQREEDAAAREVEQDGDRSARDYADYDEDDRTTFDMSDDADALASAGWGTDEDYGYYGGDD